MPLFDYRCGQCSHEFEALQGINDDALEVCPECKQTTLKKLVAAPAFTFKGSGWYKDLYGSSNTAGDKADSKSSTSTSAPAKSESTAKTSGTKTESKPAAKAG